jgi:hypothetical protein
MMALNKHKIIAYLKEEYDNRISYFLKEVDIQDEKRDVDVIKDAIGLKLSWDGFEYTLARFEKNEFDVECAILRLPDEARVGIELNQSFQKLFKDNKDIELLSSQNRVSDELDSESPRYISVPIKILKQRFERR